MASASIMLSWQDLTVLLHPQSRRPRDDHTRHAAWMGPVPPPKTDTLPDAD